MYLADTATFYPKWLTLPSTCTFIHFLGIKPKTLVLPCYNVWARGELVHVTQTHHVVEDHWKSIIVAQTEQCQGHGNDSQGVHELK